MHLIILFGIPFILILFVKDVYIKPIPRLKKVKEYLLFEKTFIKRTAAEPIKQKSALVCLYIFLWLNLTWGYSVLGDARNSDIAMVGLFLLLLANVICRALCELVLVVIPNYKYKKQTGNIAMPVFEAGNFCFCGACGTRYTEDAAFCPNCGCKNEQQVIEVQAVEGTQEQAVAAEEMNEEIVSEDMNENTEENTNEGNTKEEL